MQEDDSSNYMADSWADDQLSNRFDQDPRDEDVAREQFEDLTADEEQANYDAEIAELGE